jgi:hypothetical protein
MTAGSMATSLLKHLPEFSSGYGHELVALFQAPIMLLGGFFQGGHLLGQSTLLTLSVIRDSTSTFLNATISEQQTIPISSPRAAAASHRRRFFFASVIVKVFIKTLYSAVKDLSIFPNAGCRCKGPFNTSTDAEFIDFSLPRESLAPLPVSGRPDTAA